MRHVDLSTSGRTQTLHHIVAGTEKKRAEDVDNEVDADASSIDCITGTLVDMAATSLARFEVCPNSNDEIDKQDASSRN